MIVSRRTPPRKKKRGGLRFLLAFTTTTAMIATGGFGAFPDNPLTRTFQEVVSENFPADFLNPLNSYMESLSAPTIQPQPASASENGSQPDPLGFFQDMFAEDTSAQTPIPVEAAIVETAMASIVETQTQMATVTLGASSPTVTPILTQTQTQTSVPTQTSLFTQTSLPTATLSPLPTWTLSLGIVLPTSTKKPPPANTPTFTPTITPVPFGFIVSAVNLNGAGTSVTVPGGSTVTVTYNAQIYNDPSCPGCVTQLVTGLGTSGTHGGACAYAGTPGLFPGVLTSENITLTVPLAPGTYNVEARYYWETSCSTALANYPGGAAQTSQVIGQITVPFTGFNVNSVNLNGLGNSITVAPGSPVTVTYNYNIFDDPCPGCVTQLVTGLGTAGSQGSTCAFDGDAALFPGTPGSENVILTAPLTPGIYNVEARYYWETGCAVALANYPAGAAQTSQVIGQITVPIVLYEGGLTTGNVTSGVDGMCTANLPPGYTNYRALIGVSSTDYIANMPGNFGIPTDLPIRSVSNVIIANTWADLMDGTIPMSLSAAGITNNYWWSGAEDASGSYIDGTTANCVGWVSGLVSDAGNYGGPNSTGSQWMLFGAATCDQTLAVLCVGY